MGPNGSGKSNVVDAIRWCLGEQSVRDLRGQSAEDVIYAGRRQSVGMAEVQLTFMPTEHEAASSIDLNVGRRLFRSGESDYLVNGRKARLRDLADALRSIGIDGSRHIIVTQGMADALLSAAPMERRSLLEQAAGLWGYRVRRDEARQKLATTEQNIATIALVLDELVPRLRTLRRQARAVQDRDEAQVLLRRGLHAWYSDRWRAACTEADAYRRRAENAQHRLFAANDELTQLESTAEAGMQRDQVWQERIAALVATQHGLERDRDAARRRLSETDVELAALVRHSEATELRMQRDRQTDEDLVRRLTELVASDRMAELEATRFQSLVQMSEKEVRQVQDKLPDAQSEKQRIHAEVAGHEASMRETQQRVERLRTDLEQVVRRRQGAEELLANARETIRDHERQEALCTAGLREDEHHLEASLVRLATAEQEALTARTRLNRLDVVSARIRRAVVETRRRRDLAQRSLSAVAGDAKDSVLGAITVEPGWETAIAAALGSWAHTSLRERDVSALQRGEVPGLDAWKATITRQTGDILWASTVVDNMPAEVRNPLSLVMLVDTDQEAGDLWRAVERLPAHTVGTPPLTVASRTGVTWNAIGHRASSTDSRAASYLQLKRDATELNHRHGVWATRAARIEAARVDAAAQRAYSEGELAREHATVRDGREAVAQLKATLSQLQRAYTDLRSRVVGALEEIETLGPVEASIRYDLAGAEAAQRDTKSAVSEVTARLQEASMRLEHLEQEAVKWQRELWDARHAYDAAVSARHLQVQLTSALEAERRRLHDEMIMASAGQANRSETAARLQGQRAQFLVEVDRLEVRLCEHNDALAAERASRPVSTVTSDHLRQARATHGEIVQEHERAQALYAGSLERMEGVRAEIMDELQIPPGELQALDTVPPSPAELKRLRSRAAQYPDADQSVVEEAKELEERHEYLQEHVDDLRTAADTLRTMMNLADIEMRSRFDLAFSAVNDEFSRVFEVMLRGGHAHLEQVEGGGVDVVAQLPGKRSRTSAAFSGGERSLIASSLLFGVLKMRPTPFCVLDEVDAALDEGNVDRYLHALRDISRQTQVVVVTHNRATMAAADVLYGLTLDTEGASEVLSLRLDTLAAG